MNKTQDKVTMGKGRHEVQVLESVEADLHKHYRNCDKNRGHVNFTPVEKFSKGNLPPGYRQADTVNIIKAIADLTVRISAKRTSEKRPRYHPGTDDVYPFYNEASISQTRFGSGYVSHVELIRSERGKRCPCNDCNLSGSGELKWGEITISTATHVVFDDEEARHASCRLFFDRHDSHVVNVEGVRVEVASVEKDMTRLICVTHDLRLLKKLEAMVARWGRLNLKVHEEYKHSRFVDRLAVIVSHPHGFSKQISVGEWLVRTQEMDGESWFTYDTCTCPGSSGALVYILGSSWWHWYHDHVHSGVNGQGVNHSSAGYDDFFIQN